MASSTSNESTTATVWDPAIRPFRIDVPQEEVDELRRRVQATRWPDKETVSDRSQGVQLAKLRSLVDYWGTGYDWRKVEARLNALPEFITELDGLDIQFTHIRSPHDDALPLLMTHGWPGSIIEFLKVIEPLTNPTVHGGRAEDAFHLVLPTMPGYGFSGIPTSTGWGPARMASAFHELMLQLGYPRYVSQGGDWGAIISELLAVQAPEGLLGIHVNMPGTVPPDVLRHLRNFDPAPAELSDRETLAYDRLLHFYRDGFGYAAMMNQTPQTIGYALADSPVGMAAYYYDKFAEWTDSGGRAREGLHGRRDARRHFPLLGDQHRDVVVAVVLGRRPGRRRPVRRVRHPDRPGRGHGVPGRDLPGAAELGRAGLRQPHLLERGRQGRPLRRLGAAAALHRGGPRRVQGAALIGVRTRTHVRAARRCPSTTGGSS
jgi:pimeloyl-ACP methyl ester carboxylesterase